MLGMDIGKSFFFFGKSFKKCNLAVCIKFENARAHSPNNFTVLWKYLHICICQDIYYAIIYDVHKLKTAQWLSVEDDSRIVMGHFAVMKSGEICVG